MSDTWWEAQARIRADHVEHLRDILKCLKTGTCWCGRGIDNPMYTEHTSHCNAVQREMKGARHPNGNAGRWVAYAAKQPVRKDEGGNGIQPCGIDTHARTDTPVSNGDEPPSDDGKHDKTPLLTD